MSVSPRIEILARRAGRLLRFRVPLIVAVAFNVVLLVRIPLAEVLPGTRQTPTRQPEVAGQTDEHPASGLPVETPIDQGDPPPPTHDETGQQFLNQVEGAAAALGHWSADVWEQLRRSPPGSATGDLAGRLEEGRLEEGPTDDGRLRLVNPAANGGAVHFLINGQSHSLPAGAELIAPAGEPWVVQFHRGDELGDALYSLGPGTFTFLVSERGWNLAPAPWHSLDPAH